MTPEFLIDAALDPTLRLLPSQMDSAEARAMLLAIALQESKELRHRRQMAGGPARGFWQFEKAGVRGVLTHKASAGYALGLCEQLVIGASVVVVHRALEFQDVLACGFARLLLWTLPDALPRATQSEWAWQQYLAAWRPGKPHRHTWDAFYAEAWRIVKGES